MEYSKTEKQMIVISIISMIAAIAYCFSQIK